MNTRFASVLVTVLALAAAGCGESATRGENTDAGLPHDDGGQIDVGIEAGFDASTDAGADAAFGADADGSVNAGIDAGIDAGLHAGIDAGIDSGTDAGFNGGFDAGFDGGFDAGFDGGFDAGFDGGFDAGFDGGFDAGMDSGGCRPTWACDDCDPCTFDEPRSGPSMCRNTLITCDDGNACTSNLCEPNTGICINLPLPDFSDCPGNSTTCYAGVCESTARCDEDGDGHDKFACGGDDCDDGDPMRFPGNAEICDSLDNDCDFRTEACDDGNPCTSNVCDVSTGGCTNEPLPDFAECLGPDSACYAGICESVAICDEDGDGDDKLACGGDDCDDGNPVRYPGNIEICDDWDNDCDFLTDEGLVGCNEVACVGAPGFFIDTCGGEVCCMYVTSLDLTFSRCAEDGVCPDEAGTLHTSADCDGPEDCGSGEVCCRTWWWDLYYGTCKPEADCDPNIPQAAMCHFDEDCPSHLVCTAFFPWGFSDSSWPTGYCDVPM